MVLPEDNCFNTFSNSIFHWQLLKKGIKRWMLCVSSRNRRHKIFQFNSFFAKLPTNIFHFIACTIRKFTTHKTIQNTKPIEVIPYTQNVFNEISYETRIAIYIAYQDYYHYNKGYYVWDWDYEFVSNKYYEADTYVRKILSVMDAFRWEMI